MACVASEGVNQLALPNLGMSHIKHLRPSDRQKSRLIHKFSARRAVARDEYRAPDAQSCYVSARIRTGKTGEAARAVDPGAAPATVNGETGSTCATDGTFRREGEPIDDPKPGDLPDVVRTTRRRRGASRAPFNASSAGG
jgi:hypothetical protein